MPDIDYEIFQTFWEAAASDLTFHLPRENVALTRRSAAFLSRSMSVSHDRDRHYLLLQFCWQAKRLAERDLAAEFFGIHHAVQAALCKKRDIEDAFKAMDKLPDALKSLTDLFYKEEVTSDRDVRHLEKKEERAIDEAKCALEVPVPHLLRRHFATVLVNLLGPVGTSYCASKGTVIPMILHRGDFITRIKSRIKGCEESDIVLAIRKQIKEKASIRELNQLKINGTRDFHDAFSETFYPEDRSKGPKYKKKKVISFRPVSKAGDRVTYMEKAL